MLHHRSGVAWNTETKAKISTSLIVSKKDFPELWEKLFRITLQRMLVIQEINDRK